MKGKGSDPTIPSAALRGVESPVMLFLVRLEPLLAIVKWCMYACKRFDT